MTVSDYLQEKIEKSTLYEKSGGEDEDNEKHLLDSAFESMFVKEVDDKENGEDKSESDTDGERNEKENDATKKENIDDSTGDDMKENG